MEKRIKFLIKAGRHYANNFFRFRIIFSRTLEINWKINTAAFYEYRNLVNGWSKVMGLSEGNLKKNSIRLAWMHDSNGLQAGAYCYIDGQRHMVPLCRINPGIWYKLKITRDKTCWIIELTEGYTNTSELHTFHAPLRRWVPFLFVLHPYAGGRFTLKNDIKIEIVKK